MTGVVLTSVVDGVGVVSFNRPARHNAIDDELGREWRIAVSGALADDAVRCLLLCGEGPSFCSGRDTAHLGRRAGGESDVAFVAHAQEVRIALLESPCRATRSAVVSRPRWVLTCASPPPTPCSRSRKWASG
jgi:enoyl-CoA hydratase/carnithine racemase